MVHEAVEHRTRLAAERARLDGVLDELRGKVSGAGQQLQEAATQVAVLEERLGHLRHHLQRDLHLHQLPLRQGLHGLHVGGGT